MKADGCRLIPRTLANLKLPSLVGCQRFLVTLLPPAVSLCVATFDCIFRVGFHHLPHDLKTS